tara:strand:+ start:3242 stop:3940 length:699 start_codon:yes stop_codon:yes gene_type:complete
MPKNRPSRESIYFLVNQLGLNKPIGLTHDLNKGYHELPFEDLRFPVTRRDLSNRLKRLESINLLKGKYGLDIGCALGGMTFGLQQRGAYMVGIDRDKPSLDVARECESLYQTGASFELLDFNKDSFYKLLNHFANPITKKFDFAIWFSSFNWVAKSLGEQQTKELIELISQNVTTLIADSAIGGKGSSSLASIGIDSNNSFQEFVIKNSEYNNFTEIGTDESWYNRKVYKFI